MTSQIDPSYGYEAMADEFVARRRAANIGLSTIQRWARALPVGATVLDIGCGSGDPVAKELARLGHPVAGIDASPSLMAEFRHQIPGALWACEAVEDSTFFSRKFAAVLAIGLIFLLPEDVQRAVIRKVGDALEPGGHFLFTAPRQVCEWLDALTGRRSVSLGAQQYEAALNQNGMVIIETCVDEGENHYFSCRKRPAEH